MLPFLANRVNGTFEFFHLVVEIVVHGGFKHFIAAFRDESGLCHRE